MASGSWGCEKTALLIEKGATVLHPHSVYIADEVDLSRVSGEITIFPGCRVLGAKTVISSGVKLGAEGPVTVEDCRLGQQVELNGGYFRESVFLDHANVGSGAQVREGCLLEEEASAAHSVGLKQTILFPFVTLGSLINFCDCLMAGGTGRKDHSEVGSSYIHFNFTPDGDKATASLFGDVPRGVMLDQPPIFLGGQGGAVGPLRVGFGTVVAAGSVLRRDILEDGKLVAAGPPPDFVRDRQARSSRGLRRIVRNNLIYLANVVALEEWYRKVRRPFFARQEMGELVFAGAQEVLAGAKAERSRRLVALAELVPAEDGSLRQLRERSVEVCELFDHAPEAAAGEGKAFADAMVASTGDETAYTQAVQGLTQDVSARGVHWLQEIVDGLLEDAGALLPALHL